MKKMKIGKLALSFIIATVMLSVVALAAITYADWQNGNNTITIQKSQTALFDASLFSQSPPLYYTVQMTDPNGNVVKTWYDNAKNDDGKVDLTGLQVTPADRTISGLYTIDITANDGEDIASVYTLNLIVLNNVPAIANYWVTPYATEGDTIYADFEASDADNDGMTFRIYRNGALLATTPYTDPWTGNSGAYNLWTTSVGDAGTYIYTFEVTDGENTATQTATVVISPAGIIPPEQPKAEAKETLNLARDIELSSIDGSLLKIRNNKGESLNDFEIKITYTGISGYEKYNFDLGRNEVVYKQLSTKLPEGKTYLARIEVSAEGMDDSGYLLINS